MPAASLETKAPLWLLVMVTITGTLAMHMFVPALPEAARNLGTGNAAMQMTISVYVLGLAGGQLVYGPLSDSIGRRPMLIGGLALYTIGGLAAALAPNVHTLIAARLFQALGGCAGLALGRAIVRDTAKPEEAVGDLALLNLMMTAGPGLAPVFGSGLDEAFGWRSIFLFLATLGGITLLFTWRLLPETGRPSGTIKLGSLARDYALLLRSPSFLGFSIGGGCATTSFYGFIAAAPFIFTTQLHCTAHEVGMYLAMLIVGMAVGNGLTRRLVRSFAMERLLISGNALSVCCAVTFLAIVLSGHLTVLAVIGLMFLYALGAGMASPAALTKALSVNASVVGSAAGLYGFAQMVVGALCSYLVTFGHNPALAAASVLAGAAVLGQIGFWVALGSERAANKASA